MHGLLNHDEHRASTNTLHLDGTARGDENPSILPVSAEYAFPWTAGAFASRTVFLSLIGINCVLKFSFPRGLEATFITGSYATLTPRVDRLHTITFAIFSPLHSTPSATGCEKDKHYPLETLCFPDRTFSPAHTWALWWEDTLDLAVVVADTVFLEYASCVYSHYGLLIQHIQVNMCSKRVYLVASFNLLLKSIAFISTLSSSTHPSWCRQGFYNNRRSAGSYIDNEERFHNNGSNPSSLSTAPPKPRRSV